MADEARRLRPVPLQGDQQALPVPAAPQQDATTHSIRVSRGQRLVVEGNRTDYDFLGKTFYMASRELSRKLPHLGLTATEYDVLHTLFGTQERGGIIRATQKALADELNIGRKEVGEALRVLAQWGLIWQHRRGEYRINPRVAFYGKSDEQARALEQIPDTVPELNLPDHDVRPPRRTRKIKEAGK